MKRYFLFVIFCFFLINIFTINAAKPLNNKIFVVDPGHGGSDPGTIYKDIFEKDIVLNISLYLKNELEKRGATVYLTRDGDYDLSSPNINHRKKSDFDNRIKLINEYADYYLSIHLNYLDDSKYYGIQVFSNDLEKENANIVQEYLNNHLASNRVVKSIPNSIYMYQRLNKPGLLIECGFLSNIKERSLLITEEYQLRIAKSIAASMTKIKF